ncbi:protein SLX4IP [Polyodon spathula]|uniref:protein SLX4IP n=1 Tax=Polyodon spathula TaxID=7913 RepID=UPI001B7DE9A8|nr:protein SLX4IP [Polyodon spathula]
MTPSKFVVKCGNFVVLVDLNILPQGSSKDTSWFAEQQKEEVSILLREAVDLRVKQYLEARNQHVQPKPSKELTQANPLCIKGKKSVWWCESFLQVVRGRRMLVRTSNRTVVAYINHQGGVRLPSLHHVARKLLLWAREPPLTVGSTTAQVDKLGGGPHRESPQRLRVEPLTQGEHFRLAAYFMRRHVNLRCIVKEKYQELRVFPDKFIVCVSRQEEGPKHRTNEKSTVEKQPFTNTSEYFADPCEDKDKLNISNITQKKSSLKKIVKKGDNASEPDKFAIMKTRAGHDMDVFHPTSKPRPIVLDTSEGGTGDSENRDQSSDQVPLSELGNCINKREPAGVSSQKQPHSLELLNIGPLSGFLSLSCESALPQPKQSLGKSRIQNKRRRHYSQEDGDNAKKVFIGEGPATPSEVIMKTDSAESLTQTSMKKSPLGSKSCSKQDLVETTLDEDLLTLGKSTVKPPLENNNTEQNKLTTNIQELSVKPVSSHPNISSRTSDRKEGVENIPRKLRLRRLKKS